MADTTIINGNLRNSTGKGSARAARRAGRIPAIIFGDKKETISIDIEEREYKSTSIIKIENKNLKKISTEIENSKDLNSQQKSILGGFINNTAQLIPLLTSDSLIETDTKLKINEMTEELKLLSLNFKKKIIHSKLMMKKLKYKKLY